MAIKTLNLNLSERMSALRLFDEFKGSLSQMTAIFDDVKKVAIKPEEWTAANRVITPSANAQEAWTWIDEGSEKDFSLDQESVDYLANKIKAKSDAGEFTLADKNVIALSAKLK